MSETFNLDRKMNIDNNVDALGKQWNIVHIKGSALFEARVEPYNAQTQTPKEFEGRWTKPDLLQSKINAYLNRSWDQAEQKAKMAAANARAQEQREATRAANEAAEAEQAKVDEMKAAKKKASKKKAKKKAVKDSIDALPEEIKAEMADQLDKVLDTEDK